MVPKLIVLMVPKVIVLDSLLVVGANFLQYEAILAEYHHVSPLQPTELVDAVSCERVMSKAAIIRAGMSPKEANAKVRLMTGITPGRWNYNNYEVGGRHKCSNLIIGSNGRTKTYSRVSSGDYSRQESVEAHVEEVETTETELELSKAKAVKFKVTTRLPITRYVK